MVNLPQTLLLVNLAATWFMVGVIWFVQIVHYPLFSKVGRSGFRTYEEDHSRLTGRVVAPPMLAELSSAVFLVLLPPPRVPPGVLWLGLGLVAVAWASTALLQVPRHATLGSGFDASVHRFLVLSNWLRTAAWSTRGILLLWTLAKLLVR